MNIVISGGIPEFIMHILCNLTLREKLEELGFCVTEAEQCHFILVSLQPCCGYHEMVKLSIVNPVAIRISCEIH